MQQYMKETAQINIVVPEKYSCHKLKFNLVWNKIFSLFKEPKSYDKKIPLKFPVSCSIFVTFSFCMRNSFRFGHLTFNITFPIFFPFHSPIFHSSCFCIKVAFFHVSYLLGSVKSTWENPCLWSLCVTFKVCFDGRIV